MKKPLILEINNLALLNQTMKLDKTGKIAVSKNQLTYLKIQDAGVPDLFPYLQTHEANKPNYFGEESVGAHISVIYPEENTVIGKDELDKEHHFEVKNIVNAALGLKNYLALMVESPSLMKLRKKYGLTESLNFKGYSIGFHITVGVKF